MSDYEALFANRKIFAGRRVRQEVAERNLYRELLGDAWHDLPASLRSLHDEARFVTATGMVDIVRGKGLLARIIALVLRLPKTAQDVEATVTFERQRDYEKWARNFGGKEFSSIQYKGEGRLERLLCERFGPFVLAMAMVVEDDCLKMVVRRWKFLGLPMPKFLAPRGNIFEF